MTTLHAITQFLIGLSSAAPVFFVIYAFFILRRMEHRLHDIESKISSTLMFALQNHLKNSVDILNDMQCNLRSLVEDEQYETAEQLRVVIESHKQDLRRQVEQMKKSFGDNVNVKLYFWGEKNDDENK